MQYSKSAIRESAGINNRETKKRLENGVLRALKRKMIQL